MSDYEYSKRYYDDYPFLNARKKLFIINAGISTFCYLIIKHRLFDIFVMAVIIMNSYI